MIGFLKGKIIDRDTKSVILDVGGVGYKIYCYNANIEIESVIESGLSKKSETLTSFWTYLAVRENALDLYGFSTKEELEFFELLISVSGIGPKSAMGILSIATIPNLRRAIATGETTHLTKISGIGRKSAEKIVLELKDKIGDSEYDHLLETSGDIDALEALKSLGYGERESREALKKVGDESNVSEKVKKAMKILS